jgi:ABC-type sugar transport system permease subunit
MTPATAARPARSSGLTARLDRLSERKFALLLFVPAFLMVGLFVLPPILAVFGMSTFRIELLREGTNRFIGLNNVGRMLADFDFLASIPRTILFATGALLVTVPVAIAAALVMNRPSRFSTLISVALLLPWTIAPIVTGFYWRFMFQPSFGIATSIVDALGLADTPIPWLASTDTAMGVAVVATAWRTVPLMAILLVGALKTIPTGLYSAARMDGASAWQSFRYVTLPGIRTTLFVVIVLTIITSLQVFDIIFQLTRGGPGFETTTMAYFIFHSAIDDLSLGYSAFLAILLMAIIAAFSSTILLVRLRRRRTRAVDADIDDAMSARRTSLSATAPAASVRSGKWEDDTTRRRRTLMPPWFLRALFAAGAIVLVLWSIAPTLWIVIASLQTEGAVTSVPLHLSLVPNFEHYQNLLGQERWTGSIWVSIQVALGATLLTLLLGSLAAYPLARLDLPGKNLILAVIIATQMVPGIVLGIPVLLIFIGLGLKDTVVGLIIANVAFHLPLTIWLLKGAFEAVPRSLESSARIDGASRIGTLFRVTIPAATAGIGATAILLMISVWNEFLFAVILGDQGAVTLTRRIGFVDTPTGVSATPPYTFQAAAGVLAVLPCIVFVVLFHRRIRAGLAEGFMKG